jgi:hypothetical protein
MYKAPPPVRAQESKADSIRKLRVEFWTKRLDHTLTHTESSSRLVYIVDGAVLALLAFVFDKLQPSGLEEVVLAVPIAFLALLNYYHSQIILRQREWYGAIDERIRQTLNCEAPLTFTSQIKLGGTHHIYSRIHAAIVCFLIVVALLVVAHGFSTR